jgi:iron(III) transport system substrate-binding protein
MLLRIARVSLACSVIACLGLVLGCAPGNAPDEGSGVVNVYTHRHYDTDKKLFKNFTDQTGIAVNVVQAGADELIKRLETEGENSPADVLITVDAGRLVRAKQKGLLQAAESATLNAQVPEGLRDPEGEWFALTQRARIVVYSKDRVNADAIKSYDDLVKPEWKGKILVRSSSNLYNQSLLASRIAHDGRDGALQWAQGVVANMARVPEGNDRDQVKAIAAGIGDLAIVNTYYLGKLLESSNPEEVNAGNAVAVLFPDQGEGQRGAHVNISGAGVTRHSKNKANAIAFLEYLTGPEAQTEFAQANHEYPILAGIDAAPLVQSWGDFRADSLPLHRLGDLGPEAVKVFDEAGWR